MVARSSGKDNDFNFDDFDSFNEHYSDTANLADSHDFDDFFNSDLYNDSEADLFSDEDFKEPGLNTNYRRNQNYDKNSKNFKTKIANIPDSIYNKFSGTDNEVARYIMMVLIVVIICSIIGGTFAYLTSKNKGSDDSGYNKRLFHMTEGYPDNSNEETDIEQINTASIDNEDVPLESVSDDEPTIEDTDVTEKTTEETKAVTTPPVPTAQPAVKPTVQPTVRPTVQPTPVVPTAKPVIPTAQPAVKPETSDTSSDNNSAADNKTTDNAANNNTNNTNNSSNNNSNNSNNNNNVIPENKPEIVCSISPSAKWQEGDTYYYQYDIYVSNKTSNDINGWKGVISLSNGAEVTHLWGAKYTTNTGSFPITPEDWNKKIKSNESAYFKIELKTKSPNTLSLSLSVEY